MSISFKRFLTMVLLITNCLMVMAQESYYDCIHPKTISIPFHDAIDEEEIYYQPEDNYTYWYKIEVASNGEFNYQLNPLNEEDEYDALLYKHTGSNFCNEVVQQKITPLNHQAKSALKVKKGEVYYMGVLHLKGNGCGHVLTLHSGAKTVMIRAIQNECVEDVMETMVAESNPLDTVVENIVELTLPVETNDSILKGMVLNKSTQQPIEAVISVMRNDNTIEKQLMSSKDSGVVFTKSDSGKIITIQKLGYQSFQDTLHLTTGTYKIEVEPIKVGDKLIMKKIYFHPNTYVLKETSKQELVQLTRFMLENSNYLFEIQGHTNGNRSIKKIDKYAHLGEEWNFKGSSKKLSKLRADKIKAYLVQQGVRESQLQTIGYGGDKMIVEKPKNMKQAMKNIRVEVVVIQ